MSQDKMNSSIVRFSITRDSHLTKMKDKFTKPKPYRPNLTLSRNTKVNIVPSPEVFATTSKHDCKSLEQLQ